MSIARQAGSLLAATSLHIRIIPRPNSLSESRQILRVLQQFGEINTYRSLKYEYHNPADNSAIVIFRHPDSAQKAVEASPIRFQLEKVLPEEENADEEADEDVVEEDEEGIQVTNKSSSLGVEELMRASQLLDRRPPSNSSPNSTTTTNAAPDDLSSQPSNSTSKIPFYTPPAPRRVFRRNFELIIDRSRVVHQDYVERQVHWTRFQPMKSMAQQDLVKVVPYRGLSDVTKRMVPRTPNKVLITRAEQVHQMPSLRDMYEGRG